MLQNILFSTYTQKQKEMSPIIYFKETSLCNAKIVLFSEKQRAITLINYAIIYQ